MSTGVEQLHLWGGRSVGVDGAASRCSCADSGAGRWNSDTGIWNGGGLSGGCCCCGCKQLACHASSERGGECLPFRDVRAAKRDMWAVSSRTDTTGKWIMCGSIIGSKLGLVCGGGARGPGCDKDDMTATDWIIGTVEAAAVILLVLGLVGWGMKRPGVNPNERRKHECDGSCDV